MSSMSTPLERELYIGKRKVRNRFAIQPMECNDANLRGTFTVQTLKRYKNLFEGGAGFIVMESVTLQRESTARKTQLLLDVDDPANRADWQKFMEYKCRHYPDTVFVVQFNHSGELSDENFSKRITVKPLPGFGGELVDEEYIHKTIDLYVRAAKFLYDIGADGVDLKFCHGYLGSQILRPYNDRNWRYGGSLENRARFAYELCEKVRRAVPDEKFLIGAKFSIWDEMAGGQGHAGPDSPIIDPEESLTICRGLEERGASFFIETLGNCGVYWDLMCPGKNSCENVYRHMTAAKMLRETLKPETVVIGSGLSLLRDGRDNGFKGVDPSRNSLLYWGNIGIEQGYFDMIGLGRQSLADPYLPQKYAEGRLGDVDWCHCCNLCAGLENLQQCVGCVIHNPYYKEIYRKVSK
ncbi:MAG: 2,4-dienoyl-CoA reductase [Clostridia bacterium]|nr:2,4-dienoyl-CoA reductase [Clostridia bacterium]